MYSDELVKKGSLYDLAAHRERSIELFTRALEYIHRSASAYSSAVGGNGKGDSLYIDFGARCTGNVCRMNIEAFTKKLDSEIWHHVLNSSWVVEVMSADALQALRDEIQENPPPATAESMWATLTRQTARASELFVDAVVGCIKSYLGIIKRIKVTP